jgi:hypothetical protein
MAADDVVRQVQEKDAGSVLRLRRRPTVAPVLTISDRYLIGPLDLRAVEFPYLLEFVRCRFQRPPDVRQAKLAGCEFNACWLPGLEARNLNSDNDLLFTNGTVVEGVIDLTDGEIHGSLLLTDCQLKNPDGLTLHADRLQIAGALLGRRLESYGEFRVPGLRTGGNVTLAGANLSNPTGFSLNGNGLQVGGNLSLIADQRGNRFTSTGKIFLPSARIDSDLSMRGALLAPPPNEGMSRARVNERFFDQQATLIADRVRVSGNVDLDEHFESTGTLRIVNAVVGGSLRLTGARIDLSGGVEPFESRSGDQPGPYQFRSLHLDGTDIRGGIDIREARIAGQIRMVDVVAQGSVLFDGAIMSNRGGDVIEGRRFSTGGNLDARGIVAFGSILLPSAKIGANLDLGGSSLLAPGRYRDGNAKPAVDLRITQIGRDLICATRFDQPFVSSGEIRMRRAEIGRETNFRGAQLGGTETALNAFGVITQELLLEVGASPSGRIDLRHARAATLADNELFWKAKGRIELEDFRYDALASPIDLADDAGVKRRLRWLRHGMREVYRPGPYEQLAAMLRASGNEEHAAMVLIAKQKWRYVALAEGYRVLGPLVRMWSWLQRSMVGYGYRPMRALLWLLACLVAGTIWFAVNQAPVEANADDHLAWNPVLYTLDHLVPIVDFGHKNRWAVTGASQWISAALIAAGWILATTVAAGLTRMLRRTS